MSGDASGPARASAVFAVVNRLGLHARPAVLLVDTAKHFEAEVSISKDGQTVNAKSIMEVMLLAAAQGSSLEVTAVGADGAAAVAAIGKLIGDHFNERDQ